MARLLGQLVEREVRRRGELGTAAVEPEASDADQAIAALAPARAGIDELDQIAGRLARGGELGRRRELAARERRGRRARLRALARLKGPPSPRAHAATPVEPRRSP